MITRKFHDLTLPLLGFGAMRLPLLADGSGRVDEARTRDMVAYAMQHGLNYFDTAYPYHGGESERIMGRILADYPRESYLLATKFPSHVAAAGRTPASIFEEQLEKCGVSYFDFYLLHNVCETTTPTFCDPKLGIVDYLLEQRRLGRIRYLGFSSHGQMDNLRAFLDLYGKEMAFCQIQLNYLDWTFQKAKEKYELLTSLGIPVWVMEPVRGGRLARLDAAEEEALRALNPDLSPSAWALPLRQGPAQRAHGAQRHVQYGAASGEHRNLFPSPAPDPGRAGGAAVAGRADEEYRALHRLPLLRGRLPRRAGYSHAAGGLQCVSPLRLRSGPRRGPARRKTALGLRGLRPVREGLSAGHRRARAPESLCRGAGAPFPVRGPCVPFPAKPAYCRFVKHIGQ